MTCLLDRAIATLTNLPADQRNDIARLVLDIAGVDRDPCDLSAEQEADLDASLAEAERGEFAADDEIRALWARHGL